EIHVEDLNAAVVAVRDIDVATAHGDAMGNFHIPVTRTISAVCLLPHAILGYLDDPGIHIAVADIDGAVRSPGHIGGPPEGSHIAVGMGIFVLTAALDKFLPPVDGFR